MIATTHDIMCIHLKTVNTELAHAYLEKIAIMIMTKQKVLIMKPMVCHAITFNVNPGITHAYMTIAHDYDNAEEDRK